MTQDQDKPRKQLTDQLVHSTVRIECSCTDGETGIGTGFFFTFLREGGSCVPTVVTNKHVVEDAVSGAFWLTRATDDQTPEIGHHWRLDIPEFGDRWVPHPDPEVDLCLMPFASIENGAAEKGISFYRKAFDKTFIPDQQGWRSLAAVEDILMVGYPIGLWDSRNNLPVTRRGITASPPQFDHESRPEFMIDAACFPGSSGSPVILMDEGSLLDHLQEGFPPRRHLLLLGVLHSIFEYAAEGRIVRVKVPTRHRRLTWTQVPMELGLVIKSHRILEFEPVLAESLASSRGL